MEQLAILALVLVGIRYPYFWISILCIYLAYAKPDMLPIVTMVILYGMYKLWYKVMKSISKENIIKH